MLPRGGMGMPTVACVPAGEVSFIEKLSFVFDSSNAMSPFGVTTLVWIFPSEPIWGKTE